MFYRQLMHGFGPGLPAESHHCHLQNPGLRFTQVFRMLLNPIDDQDMVSAFTAALSA